MDVDARLEAMAEERDRLVERIAYLEGLMGYDFLPPVEWRVTGSEARVLGVLLAREFATKDAIMAALYRDQAKDEAEIKIVDVFVCKLRKKLKPFGLEITTIWGVGYAMPPATKALVREAMGEREAA